MFQGAGGGAKALGVAGEEDGEQRQEGGEEHQEEGGETEEGDQGADQQHSDRWISEIYFHEQRHNTLRR